VRVVADSHAIAWYVQGSSRLSGDAADALAAAEASDGIVVSVATFVDLWYVAQTTAAVTIDDLARLRVTLESSDAVALEPITLDVIDATTSIPRDVLADPWDRFIVATAMVLGVPLVTRDSAIHKADLVTTVWW
jgi:PIN domain nuclease of toxin-antitoxin system